MTQYINKNKNIILNAKETNELKKNKNYNEIENIIKNIRQKQIYLHDNLNIYDCENSYLKLHNTYTDSKISNKKRWGGMPNKNNYKQESRRAEVIKHSKFDFYSSNFFHEKQRLKCSIKSRISPEEAFSENILLENILINCLSNLPKNQPLTLEAIKRTTCLFYKPPEQFNPLAAKYIINKYTPEGGSVLDFCCGWGDRLSGFYASHASSYIGIESNNALLDGYIDQIDFLSEIEPKNKNKECNIFFDKAENIDYSDLGKQDLIFTSPPRFDLENYNHKESSTQTYKRFSEWKKKFLNRAILSSWECLKKDGYMAIHMDDYRKNRKRVEIVNYLLGHISSNLNATRLPPIGYTIQRRHWSGEDKKSIEPIWIWQKK